MAPYASTHCHFTTKYDLKCTQKYKSHLYEIEFHQKYINAHEQTQFEINSKIAYLYHGNDKN